MLPKLNWGHRIFIGATLFMIGTLSFVFYATTVDYDLVTEKHYEEGVHYQEKIDEMNHARNLSQPVEIAQDRQNREIEIRFPKADRSDSLSGQIVFYRPDDDQLDRTVALNLGSNGIQRIPANGFRKGKWRVKMSWNDRKQKYYEEKILYLD